MCTYAHESVCVHVMEHVWVRHNFWDPIHSAHCACHWDQTQATRLDSKHPYLLSLLTHSHKFFIFIFSDCWPLVVLPLVFPLDNTSSFNSFAQIEASGPYHQITYFSCVTLHTHTFIQSMSYFCV